MINNTLPSDRTMNGYFILPTPPTGTTALLEDITGQCVVGEKTPPVVVPMHENGIGGLAANLTAGRIYRVTLTLPNDAVCGWHMSMTNEEGNTCVHRYNVFGYVTVAPETAVDV